MDSLNTAFTKAQSNFKTWFAGSRVVDGEGGPLVVFHATVADFDPSDFRPLSHFGSAEAANFMAICKEMDGDPGGRLFPVFLKMKNPLEIPDIHEHDRESFANLFSKRWRRHVLDWMAPKIMSRDEWRHCFEADTQEDEDAWRTRMIAVLEAKGYDGFMYRNAHEDLGSMSYINFQPEQIRPALSEPDTYGRATQYLGKVRCFAVACKALLW